MDDLSFDQIFHRPGKLQIFFVLFYEIIKKKACMIKYLLFRIFLADASLINLSCLVRYLKIEGWKIFDCALL